MDNRVILEEEHLNLSEGIQEFGYLLIVDLDYNLIAGSENCEHWLNNDVINVLGLNLWEILTEYFSKYVVSIKIAIDQVINETNERVLLELTILDEPYYLNIYLFNDKFYLEFEKKFEDSNVFFPKFEIVDKLLSDSKGKIWKVVSSYISKISGFDRVRVFQYVGNGDGYVVAESIENSDLEKLLGSYYPDMDIFKHAKNIHTVNFHRYTAQVNGKTIKIISKDHFKPNLSQTNIRMISPLHAKYLIKDGVNSNLSVSLQIDGKIWGYVFCQSKKGKKINLLKREAMVYFIQMAIYRYEEEQKNKIKDFQDDIRNFELQLKEKLILKNNLAEAFMELDKELCYYAKADAMLILINGRLYTYNISIGFDKVLDIKGLLSRITADSIFFDSEFILKYGEELGLDAERFVGLAALKVELEENCTVFWFRKEKELKRKWVAKPESRINLNLPNDSFEKEEHPVLDIWHQKTVGTCEPWQDNEVYFIKRLRNLIIQSSKNFSQEIDKLNKEVVDLNRALDNYAHTVSHDLKNPLSAINLSTQMLLQRPEMKNDLKLKMLKNTTEAVEVISELLKSIHDFSKVKDYQYRMEPVYVDEFLKQIVNFSQLRYNAMKTEVQYGNILPVYGERSIVYQLFQNLIGNAIKYSAKVENPVVSISSSFKHEFVRYTIQDNGIGIAKEELSTIYDSFKRMSNANNYEGTGLGLTIVKRIADRLHITIEVESEIGKGTCFHLLFPKEVFLLPAKS